MMAKLGEYSNVIFTSAVVALLLLMATSTWLKG